MSEQFTADLRFAVRQAFFWWETYLALGMGIVLAAAFINGSIKDTLLRESQRQIYDVRAQADKANKDTAKIMADLQIIHAQNMKSMEDRANLNEDRVRLDSRLEFAEKNQANVQKALENAQRSFNEARDVLRRLEQTGKVKP